MGRRDEDSKLKDAVQTHGVNDWKEIAALVPGRTKEQCRDRWNNTLDPRIDRANERTRKWAEDEDSKLVDAVQTHGGKSWGAIAALVPGRTEKQCHNRWKDVLDPSIDRASGRKGEWTAVENSKLKDAVQTHGDKNWGAISMQVPGRTRKQCFDRWRQRAEVCGTNAR
jgi:myb proto-oncogene protein